MIIEKVKHFTPIRITIQSERELCDLFYRYSIPLAVMKELEPKINKNNITKHGLMDLMEDSAIYTLLRSQLVEARLFLND